MNVFDFDGTIYNGDSSIDFCLFCFSKNFSLIKYLPKQFFGGLFYKMGKITKEEFKSQYFSFLYGICNIDKYVNEFWDKNEHKIKKWYKNLQQKDDCVISASPEFLLIEICKRLGIQNLIATKVDKQNGNLLGKNCHDKNKLDFFVEHFRDEKINKFYSDSKTDYYLANIAAQAYLVKGDKINEWKK